MACCVKVTGDKMEGWNYQNGELHIDNVPITSVQDYLNTKYQDLSSPIYVYSASVIRKNVKNYVNALSSFSKNHELSYSMKANNNFALINEIIEAGATRITTVNGNEIRLALKTNVEPQKILYNGNGKKMWEIQLALENDLTVNIDALFDAQNLLRVAEKLRCSANVLIRVNPNLETLKTQHQYLSTSLKNSKFGLDVKDIDECLRMLKTNPMVFVNGLHIHLGSTIAEISFYKAIVPFALDILKKIREYGYPTANLLNLGGGLVVNGGPWAKDLSPDLSISTNDMSPSDLVQAISTQLPEDVKLVIEPGRSLIGNAGVIVTQVIGMKSNGNNNFVVVDAAMTEIIRPCLYGAVHAVTSTTMKKSGDSVIADIVGPVCESGDFLAKSVEIPIPIPKTLVIWSAGAYCFSMSSNYNMRTHIAEVLIKDNTVILIRRPQTFGDLIRNDCFLELNE